MFTIQHLKGNTYYMNAPTNMGLYKLDEKNCILIDACHAGPMTDELLRTLEHYGLHIQAVFNTHGHIDHFGGISALKKKYHATIAAPPFENTFIEHPELYAFLLLPFIPFSLTENFYLPKGVNVEILLHQPQCIFENVNFGIVPLQGHTPNQVGIVTPDNVIFVGDAFVGEPHIERIKIYYNQNISGAIDSMRFLLKTNYDFYVPSHGNPLTAIESVIEKNLESIHSVANHVYEMLSKCPLSTDEIMAAFNTQFGIAAKFIEYYITQSCIMSILSFLENTGKIQPVFHNGTLKFTVLREV